MRRLLGSAECLSLIDLVLSEADSDTGTWSLASYVKIRNVVPHFASTDMALFVKSVLDLILSPTTKTTTRYKLAQILSAIHSLGVPEFDHLMRGFMQEIEDSCEEISQSGELGKPTVKLLKSLAVDRSARTGAGQEMHLRRVSATPVYLGSDGAFLHRMSRSPDPGLPPSASLL
jgi:hypothetical protein